MTIEAGQEAPDFELKNQFGEPVRLSSFRGASNVVLVFFPKAFTPTCTGELREIRDELPTAGDDETVVLGISCDTTATLKVFAENEKYDFDLLSDFWPHGAVAQLYHAFFEPGGFAMRATFIIDKAGVLRWSVVNGPGEVRRTSDYGVALAAL